MNRGDLKKLAGNKELTPKWMSLAVEAGRDATQPKKPAKSTEQKGGERGSAETLEDNDRFAAQDHGSSNRLKADD